MTSLALQLTPTDLSISWLSFSQFGFSPSISLTHYLSFLLPLSFSASHFCSLLFNPLSPSLSPSLSLSRSLFHFLSFYSYSLSHSLPLTFAQFYYSTISLLPSPSISLTLSLSFPSLLSISLSILFSAFLSVLVSLEVVSRKVQSLTFSPLFTIPRRRAQFKLYSRSEEF